jgi:hypothetical protein
MGDYTTREVDGVSVALTQGEIAELEARDAAFVLEQADTLLLSQIRALELLQTPRLVRESQKKKDCVVNKPGTIIHGLSPEGAMDAIDEALDALRAQLTNVVYYQTG